MTALCLTPLRRLIRLSLLAVALAPAALLAPAASAQAEDDVPDPVEEARAHFEAARAYFGAERFDDAAVEFERAHELLPAPELLFNAALSHERAEHSARALELYERYLVEYPTGDDIVETGRRLAALRERTQAEAPPTEVEPETPDTPPDTPIEEPTVTSTPDAPAVMPAPAPGPDATLVGIGAALVGLGAIAGGVGIGLGVVALDDLARLEEGCPDNACPGELEPVRDEYVAFATANTVLLPIAGTLIVGGVILLIVGLTSGGEESAVSASANGVRVSF